MKQIQTRFYNQQLKNNQLTTSNKKQQEEEKQQVVPAKIARFQTPILKNLHQYDKVMLIYDAPFDIRYFTKQLFYDEEYQRQQKPIIGVKEYKNEKIAILEVDNVFKQVRDPTHIIKQLKSLSSQEAYEMANQIERNYLNFQKLLPTADKLESKGYTNNLDRDKLYQKVIQATKKITKSGSKLVLINVLSMDVEQMEMKKIAVGGTYEFGNVILPKRNQLLSSLIKLGSFNYGGDMKIFTKHQFPDCEKKDIQVCIHTLDGFILPCISRLHSIPLDDQNLNIFLAKQFIIDPLLLEKLKDIRKKMNDYGIESLLTEDKYGEKQYINLSHMTVNTVLNERMQFKEDGSNHQFISNNSQNDLENKSDQKQYQSTNNTQMYPSQEKFISMTEYENNSSDENMIIFKEENSAAMCFEPPQFEVSDQEKLISQEMMVNQERILRQQQIQIQQSLNNTQRFQSILNEQKTEALKFINRFYNPQIK